MRNIIIVIFCLSFFACCKRKDEPVIYVSQRMKDLYFFKNGSNWTMRDSLTGRIDSFYVSYTDSLIETYSVGKYEANYISIKEVNINNVDAADSMRFSFHLESTANTIDFKDYKFSEDFHSDGFGYGDITYSVFNYNGVNYTNVTEANDRQGIYVNLVRVDTLLYPSDYYLNKTEGFIKIRFNTKYHHFVWELLNSNIIR